MYIFCTMYMHAIFTTLYSIVYSLYSVYSVKPMVNNPCISVSGNRSFRPVVVSLLSSRRRLEIRDRGDNHFLFTLERNCALFFLPLLSDCVNMLSEVGSFQLWSDNHESRCTMYQLTPIPIIYWPRSPPPFQASSSLDKGLCSGRSASLYN